MSTKVLVSLAALAVAMSSPVWAKDPVKEKDRSIDLTRAKDVVDRIRLPDLPVVSTGTVVMPIQRPRSKCPQGAATFTG